MFGSKLKIRKELLERVEAASGKLGCSPDEFVERCIEVELERLANETPAPSGTASDAEVDEIMGKLKGLGYID